MYYDTKYTSTIYNMASKYVATAGAYAPTDKADDQLVSEAVAHESLF